MKNPVGKIKYAWYNKLKNQLFFNTLAVPVYREDADKLPSSHYVLLRSAGSRKEPVDAFMRRVSIFVQVVTVFHGAQGINDSIVDEIDEQIGNIARPTFLDDALDDSTDFQITMVSNEEETYETFIDSDQGKKYHIKTTRWEHLAVEKTS